MFCFQKANSIVSAGCQILLNGIRSGLLSVAVPFGRRLAKFLNVEIIPKDSIDFFYNLLKKFKNQHHEDKSVSIKFIKEHQHCGVHTRPVVFLMSLS